MLAENSERKSAGLEAQAEPSLAEAMGSLVLWGIGGPRGLVEASREAALLPVMTGLLLSDVALHSVVRPLWQRGLRLAERSPLAGPVMLAEDVVGRATRVGMQTGRFLLRPSWAYLGSSPDMPSLPAEESRPSSVVEGSVAESPVMVRRVEDLVTSVV